MTNKERKGLLLSVMIVAALIVSGGCQTAAFAETVLKTGGSGFGLGLMKLLAEAYEKKHPEVKVTIMPSLGSSGGIKALLQGVLDFSLSARPLKEEEKSKGANAAEFARTPFVFISNYKVTAHGITTHELEKIYGGSMTAWPDGTRIRLVLRPDMETDTKIVKGLSPRMEQAVRSAMSREGMILAVTDQESSDAVEKTTGSLGGSTLAQVVTEKRRVNLLSFNSVKPSVKGITDGSYPLSKSLYLVTTQKIPAAVRQFMEFIRSKEGGRILKEHGTLPVETKMDASR